MIYDFTKSTLPIGPDAKIKDGKGNIILEKDDVTYIDTEAGFIRRWATRKDIERIFYPVYGKLPAGIHYNFANDSWIDTIRGEIITVEEYHYAPLQIV